MAEETRKKQENGEGTNQAAPKVPFKEYLVLAILLLAVALVMLYLVYQVQSTANLPEDGVHESFSYYYAVRFDDLTVVPDGTVSVSLDEYDTTSDTFSKKFGDRSFRYRGYEDLDSAFQECVSTNLEQYAYESNIKTE